MSDEIWLVRLSEKASADFDEILDWTKRRFGESQARKYETTLVDAITKLQGGPDVLGAKDRTDIGHGLYTFHIA